MNDVKAVIFDLGRVLLGITTNGAKFSALMDLVGIQVGQAFDTFWHEAAVERHMTGAIDSRKFYDQVSAKYRLPFEYVEFVEGWCDLFHPIPGMCKIFSDVATRYRVGILSDTDPLHWWKAMEILPWLDVVKHPTLSFDIGRLKPHPDMYRAAAANVGCVPNQCLFIDDVQINVEGARKIGMRAIRFAGSGQIRRDLTELGILTAANSL